MTIELVRRVLLAGVAPRDVVAEALLEAVRWRRPFLAVLAALRPDVGRLVAREVERLGLAEVDAPVPDAALVARCPAGMLEALGVIPISQDPTTGEVIAATADPLDAHAAEELAYHLGEPVLLLRAPVHRIAGPLTSASSQDAATAPVQTPVVADLDLEALRPPRMPDLDPPVVPALLRRSGSAAEGGSEPPIPLVRLSSPPGARRSPAPVLGARSSPPPRLAHSERPVPGRASAEPSRGRGSSMAPGGRDVLPTRDVHGCVDAMDRAVHPDDVVALLVAGIEALGAGAVVLSDQGAESRGRAASRWIADAARIRAVGVSTGTDTVIDRALRDGLYSGALPDDAAHRGLSELLGPSSSDVHVVPVRVRGRAAVTVVAAGLDQPSSGARRIDELASAAARALERILRSRKGG